MSVLRAAAVFAPTLLTLALLTNARAAELGVLSPVLAAGTPVAKPDAAGRPAPVLTRLTSGALYDALQKEAREGFTATILALDEIAQRKAGASAPTPTWLYLSLEDGGFPRAGFWLREAAADRWVPDPFVDLVVDAASVADGGFEEIFAHEMGHVFLRRLYPALPPGFSRARHSSLTITDFPTAFDEGFATHFQALVRRFTANERLRNRDLGIGQKPLTNYWYDNIDREARVAGVRGNWFVQAQLPLPADAGASVFTRQDYSTLFDSARLKNGSQMLASEGVIATLFYRRLAAGPRESLIERYSREFDYLREVDARHAGADRPPMLDLLAVQRRRDAQQGALDTWSFIETTQAATVDPALSRDVERLARLGRLGDMKSFVGELATVRARFAALRERVARQGAALAHPGVGPDLWALLEAPPDVAVNLNTAELAQMVALPGVGEVSAARALESRRMSGPFASFEDFARRAGIDRKAAGRLLERAAAMKAAGPMTRR